LFTSEMHRPLAIRQSLLMLRPLHVGGQMPVAIRGKLSPDRSRLYQTAKIVQLRTDARCPSRCSGLSGFVARRECQYRGLVATLGLLFLVAPQAATAYRPFDSTDADVADTGKIELELGPVGYLQSRETRGLFAPSVILNWGFLPRWELVLQGRNLILLEGRPDQASPKLIETGIFLKGVLRPGSLQDGTGLSIATEVGPLLPTVHEEPGIGFSGALIVSQRWPAATVHVNGQVEWSRAHNLDLFGSVILEGPYAWPVRPATELFIEREFGGSRQVSALVGAIWRASNSLAFDAAVRRARRDELNVLELRVGFTWGFELIGNADRVAHRL
jgi:hypothetical protein